MRWLPALSFGVGVFGLVAACGSESTSGSGGSTAAGGAGEGGHVVGGAGTGGGCTTAADCDLDACRYAVEQPGACVNEADLTKIQPLNYDLEWNKCVPGCVTNVDCNTSCFVDNTGLSEPCARCFAELVQCWIVNCASACPNGGGSPECFACVEQACMPDYQTCFGTLLCPYELACGDHFDNDGNGLVDGADPACP